MYGVYGTLLQGNKMPNKMPLDDSRVSRRPSLRRNKYQNPGVKGDHTRSRMNRNSHAEAETLEVRIFANLDGDGGERVRADFLL